MDEIANSAGFGKATLYYYFKSKEEVLSAILEDGWQNIWESLEPIIAEQESPRKTFVNVLIKIAENAQDLISAFYYLRAFYPKDKLKINETFSINMFFDKENYVFKMKYTGKENLSTKFGKIKCMKFRPYVQSGRVFREKESVTIWITDDVNKIPIKLQADLAIGSIKVDLDQFKNLNAPFDIQYN